MKGKRLLSRAEVDVDVWEERDRLSIVIKDKKTGQRTIAEWWDDDARQMFEDGFFKRGVELKRSVIAYAEEMGLLAKPGAVRPNVFVFNNPGNAQKILVENFMKGANSGVAGSLYIHGNRIYSYGPHFPIAQRTSTLGEPTIISITSKKAPSRTTAGHISLIERAAREAGMLAGYTDLLPEAKGPAAYSNPGKKKSSKCPRCGRIQPRGPETTSGACLDCDRTSPSTGAHIPGKRGVVRKNVFVFNNPRALFNPRDLGMVEKAAAAVGLVVGTWAPGDGVTRYRFFLSDGKSRYGDYHQGDGLYTALGRKDAMMFISAYGKGRGTRKNPLTHRETSTVVESARFHARMARSVTPGTPYRSHLLGVAEGQANVAAQYGHGKNRRRAGEMVSAIDRMAMAKGGPYMRFSHKPIRRNPAVCSNPIVRGDKLPFHLQQEVLRKFIYRWTTGNTQRVSAWSGISGKPRIPLISDEQWLRKHAFHVTKAGKLDERHHHAEPYFMADDWKKGDPIPNPLLQTIMLNPPISAQWDRMTGRQRLELLELVGFPEDYAGSYARLPWSSLSAVVRTRLEREWLDSTAVTRGGTTRRRPAMVGTNPLTRKESAQILSRARHEIKLGSSFRPGHTRSASSGQAWAHGNVVEQYGPRSASRAASKVKGKAMKMAGTTLSNPGGLRLPKPGTKMTVTQALELAQRIGNRGLIEQCRKALKLQKVANKNAKCVIWKTFPMGSSDKIDSVVALTHYGDSPETMYQPPKGSKKGNHMYRHKWGEKGGKKSVPLLASADGKMLLMPLEGKKIASDWLRH